MSILEIFKMANQRTLQYVSAFVVLLLGIRFFYSAVTVSLRLSTETHVNADLFFETYEILLPFAIFASLVILALSWQAPPMRTFSLGILAFHLVTLIVWLYYLNLPDSQSATSLYPPLAAIAVASGSLLSLGLVHAKGLSFDHWREWAYLALLLVVPAVFSMRTAVILGVGTSPGPTGALQGNWFLVYTPTILLEFLVIWVWLNLVLNSEPLKLRRRWYSFLPFALLPLSIAGFTMRPLSGFILSALITWGSNLPLFIPAPLSLSLAVTAVACYLSTFILVKRENNRLAWKLLLAGTSAVILSGFYPSMATVEGLTFGLAMIAVSMASWKRKSSLH